MPALTGHNAMSMYQVSEVQFDMFIFSIIDVVSGLL
jgi:hypothetical protein